MFECPSESANTEKQRSINFVTGIPLTASLDPSGGFGDIAANLSMALEFKRRFPQAIIRLIVTSKAERPKPQIPTTNEILVAMVPSLLPDQLYLPQIHQGIEVVFTHSKFSAFSTDAMSVLERGPSKIQNLTRHEMEELTKQVPVADYAIQLSANHSPMQVLTALGRIAISFGEHSLNSEFVDQVLPAEESLSAQLVLNSGFNLFGVYLVEPKPFEAHRELVNRLLTTRKRSELLFAYGKSLASTQLYIDALTVLLKNDPRKFDFFVKDFRDLDTSGLPKGVTVHRQKIPFEASEALFHLSAFSPLACGDVSSALALSYTTENRSVVLEVPEWKEGHFKLLESLLKPQLLPAQHPLLESIFLHSRELKSIPRGSPKWNETVERLAAAMQDRPFNKRFGEAVHRSKPSWDIAAGIERLFDFLEAIDFKTFSSAPQEMLELGIAAFQRENDRNEIEKQLSKTGSYTALFLLSRMGVGLNKKQLAKFHELLIPDSSLTYDPWTAIIPISTPAEQVLLNTRVNESFLGDKITPFLFLRAKLSLPFTLIQSEASSIDYARIFREYLENPIKLHRTLRIDGNSYPTSSLAFPTEVVAKRFLELRPSAFYEYYKQKLTGLISPNQELLSFLNAHNQVWQAGLEVPADFAKVVETAIERTVKGTAAESYSGWSNGMPAAMEALAGLPLTRHRLELVEQMIESKQRPKACEFVLNSYETAKPKLRPKLALLIGICMSDVAEDHYRELVAKLAQFLRSRTEHDSVVLAGVTEAMDRKLSLWGRERIAVAAAAGFSSFEAVPEFLKEAVKYAATLKFRGMPDQAREMVSPSRKGSCKRELLPEE